MLIDLEYIKNNIGKTIELSQGKKTTKFKISSMSDAGFIGTLIRNDNWNGIEMHFILPIELTEDIKININA